MKSIMTNMEFLTEWKIWSHPYSFSSLIFSPSLCWVGLYVWWEPGEDFSLCTELLIFFRLSKQGEMSCWRNDWRLQNWWFNFQWARDLKQHHWEIRDAPGCHLAQEEIGRDRDPEPSSTRSIFSSADLMAWGGRWAATAWGNFPLPWAQLGAVALGKSSSVTATATLIPAAQRWLRYQHTHITHCTSERRPFETISCIFTATAKASLCSIISWTLQWSVQELGLFLRGAALTPGQFHTRIFVCGLGCFHSTSGRRNSALSSTQRHPACKRGPAAARICATTHSQNLQAGIFY